MYRGTWWKQELDVEIKLYENKKSLTRILSKGNQRAADDTPDDIRSLKLTLTIEQNLLEQYPDW